MYIVNPRANAKRKQRDKTNTETNSKKVQLNQPDHKNNISMTGVTEHQSMN